jgi:hypothetical protein
MIDLLNEGLNVEKSLKGHTSLKSGEGGASGPRQINHNFNNLTQGFSKFLDRDPF